MTKERTDVASLPPCPHFICRLPNFLKPEVRKGYCDVRSFETNQADMAEGRGKCAGCTSRPQAVATADAMA